MKTVGLILIWSLLLYSCKEVSFHEPQPAGVPARSRRDAGLRSHPPVLRSAAVDVLVGGRASLHGSRSGAGDADSASRRRGAVLSRTGRKVKPVISWKAVFVNAAILLR